MSFDPLDYDPLNGPDPREWLTLPEEDKLEAVAEYHRALRVRVPNLEAHAIFHVIVENQIAFGDELPVKATLERLMAQGLDRHEAVHAIGAVLASHMHTALKDGADAADREELKSAYYRELERLTPESWRRRFGEPESEE